MRRAELRIARRTGLRGIARERPHILLGQRAHRARGLRQSRRLRNRRRRQRRSDQCGNRLPFGRRRFQHGGRDRGRDRDRCVRRAAAVGNLVRRPRLARARWIRAVPENRHPVRVQQILDPATLDHARAWQHRRRQFDVGSWFGGGRVFDGRFRDHGRRLIDRIDLDVGGGVFHFGFGGGLDLRRRQSANLGFQHLGRAGGGGGFGVCGRGGAGLRPLFDTLLERDDVIGFQPAQLILNAGVAQFLAEIEDVLGVELQLFGQGVNANLLLGLL